MLDLLNDADTIRDAFADYYRATILAGESDPDKLHDLQADLDAAQVYSPAQIEDLVQRYLGGADRDQLDPILDVCAAVYVHDLDEDAQVDFKGKAKAFVRTYGFLSSGCGREPGCPGPPAQIRTCALTHTAPTSGG